jgi:sn-glycerol 3-phosphate transport system permease protein
VVERTPLLDAVTHAVLILALVVMCFPIYVLLITATLPIERMAEIPRPLLPDGHLWANLQEAWVRGRFGRYLTNSLIMTLAITVGKIAIATITAFALVYFRFRFRMIVFWLVFITLMLPLEVRIVPTYEVAANALLPFQRILDWTGVTALARTLTGVEIALRWSMINSYWGLTLPLIATATGTFLFRQFYLTVPDELTEAAKMDGAGAMRFFRDVLLPLSKTNIAALAVIMFVFGWNQYLWPLLVTTGDAYRTVTVGLTFMRPDADSIADWNVTLAGALIAMAPPVLVVILAQRWFVKGLVNQEK